MGQVRLGKIYGQWICGATVFAYDMDKVRPRKAAAEDTGLQAHDVLRSAHYVSLHAPGRRRALRPVQRREFRNRGEPLNAEVTLAWERLTGKKIREGFGRPKASCLHLPWIEPRPGSMGKPSPLFNIRLLDENGNEMDDGEEGAICVTK
ncbi:MAG: AMP-binding protein [Eggerthellaceae bacterium]